MVNRFNGFPSLPREEAVETASSVRSHADHRPEATVRMKDQTAPVPSHSGSLPAREGKFCNGALQLFDGMTPELKLRVAHKRWNITTFSSGCASILMSRRPLPLAKAFESCKTPLLKSATPGRRGEKS
jgi:hypothetical protein